MRLARPFADALISGKGAYGDRRYRTAQGGWVTHFHCGLDYALEAGTPVRASADGRVVEVSSSKVRGHMVAIDYGNGDGLRYHMLASRRRAPLGPIKAGAIVGYVADADEQGSSSSGDHLHVEARTGGRLRGETAPRANTPNPANYYAGTAPAGIGTNPLEDDMEYKDWSYESKKMLQRDIWHMGLGGIPNTAGDMVSARDILAGAEREATKAAANGFTQTRDDRLRVAADTLTGGTPFVSHDGEVLALLKGIAGSVGIDVAALARQLAPLLDVQQLDADDLAALSQAVNDESDRRERERLGT